jgi:succinyl-CoA synthetase alpha subunit
MSTVKTHIIRQEYHDSVQLMKAASKANKIEGVEIASVLMGTPNNKPLLKEVNLLTPEAHNAGANDVIIVVRADTNHGANKAIDSIIESLSEIAVTAHDSTLLFRSIRGALTGLPNANLAVISVPGEYAARDSRIALANNLNVLLFSDNVSIDDELALKQEAHSRGLLLMGPDCGTAMIKNIGLGFANVVNPGPIGIIAASGTGTQEVMTLCSNLNSGVTHAIGTGSRDITNFIGGITMIDGIRALDNDPSIELIVIISKPPEDKTLNKILVEISKCSKPAIINFLGKKAGYFDHPGKTITVDTLEEAAYTAVEFLQTRNLIIPKISFDSQLDVEEFLLKTKAKLLPEQQFIRGLYAGGTFTFETVQIIRELLPIEEKIYSNVHLKGVNVVSDIQNSTHHTLLDMGDDQFTIGKPHPMIDQSERTSRFLKELSDPETAVIILDFVLGYGSHNDPVSDMKEAFKIWKLKKRYIPIIAHVCGTPLDPQEYQKTLEFLKSYGVFTLPTNAQTAKLAVKIVQNHRNIKE